MRVEFPGLFDIQVNGFAGVDFNTPGVTAGQIEGVIPTLRQTGVTRFLPTLITASLERFSACARALAGVNHQAVAGIHMEGPYISPIDGARGAHPREQCCAASLDDFKRRQDATGGRIVLVTLAPEVPGALQLIGPLVSQGVRVAIGHTDASPGLIRDAVREGATLSTHLGNGCAAVLPRHPNFIWEQLADDDLWASVIVDGHHLPPATAKAIIRAKTPERTILVTDAMAAAGCEPGTYRIGELEVEVATDKRVSLRGTPYLAGSSLAMNEAVANTVRFTGLSLKDALLMASAVPAAYLEMPTAGTVTAEWDDDAFRLSVVEVSDN